MTSAVVDAGRARRLTRVTDLVQVLSSVHLGEIFHNFLTAAAERCDTRTKFIENHRLTRSCTALLQTLLHQDIAAALKILQQGIFGSGLFFGGRSSSEHLKTVAAVLQIVPMTLLNT